MDKLTFVVIDVSEKFISASQLDMVMIQYMAMHKYEILNTDSSLLSVLPQSCPGIPINSVLCDCYQKGDKMWEVFHNN